MPKHWALATFFIPISASIAYGIWLAVSAAGLAHSTQAENAVRAGALVTMSIGFGVVPRPWARAVAIASVAALALAILAVLEFEMLRTA